MHFEVQLFHFFLHNEYYEPDFSGNRYKENELNNITNNNIILLQMDYFNCQLKKICEIQKFTDITVSCS